MEQKIVCLVGMIASGKSTYAGNAAKDGAICVNDDAIVNMVHSDNYTLYNQDLKILYKTIEHQAIGMALAMRRRVVVDRGLNISVQGRRRWLALANSFDTPCVAVVFKNEGPEVHARRRVEHDARGHDYDYWLKVARFHNKVYCEPHTGEGFAAVHFITFDEIKESHDRKNY